MSHSICEKILAKASGLKNVEPGDFVESNLDGVFFHEITGSQMYPYFEELGVDRIWDPKKVAVNIGHIYLFPSIGTPGSSAVKKTREFVKKMGVKYYSIGGATPLVFLTEKNYLWPGAMTCMADSHGCAYGVIGAFSTGIGSNELAIALATGKLWFRVPPVIKFNIEGDLINGLTPRDVLTHIIGEVGEDAGLYKAIEFDGNFIEKLGVRERFIFTVSSVELGGKTGFTKIDDKAMEYSLQRIGNRFDKSLIRHLNTDSDYAYEKIYDFDVSELKEPLLACPDTVSNVKPISEVEGIEIDQAFIGGCTTTGIKDLQLAAKILKDRKVHPDVRLLVVPPCRTDYQEADKKRLFSILTYAGAVVTTPNCGACATFNMGALDPGQVMVGTHGRNFPGRAGKDTKVYLGSAATVASSAIEGKIADPRKYFGMNRL